MSKRNRSIVRNNVLLLDGGGTQTLPIAKAIHKRGHYIHIFFEHKLTYGYATRYASYKVQAPSVRNEEVYFRFLTDYIERNFIDVLIPMSDPSAMFLSKYKNELLKISRFLIPDYDLFMKGYDKNELMRVCIENGFPHPKTRDLKIIDFNTIEDTFFPAILKPNITTGGRGMKILNRKHDLDIVYEMNVKEFGFCHLQELIPSGGRQFKVELYIDDNHELVNSSVIYKQRYYPITGGSSCFNITINDVAVVDLCYSVLKVIGWIGFADFDLIEDPRDGIFKIMEINPRIPACVKSAVDSGVDYGNLIVDSSMGREVIRYNYIPGKQLRHIGFDTLWFLKSKDRFKTKPNWFNFFNKNQSFQDFSISDPLPFLYGTIGNIKKMSSDEFRKSKNTTRLT